MQRFAAGLVAQMRWLADGRHIGQVCARLERCEVDPDRWTIDAFMNALATGNKRAGFTVAEPVGQRDPVVYLGWQIRNAIDPNKPTPAEEAQLHAIQARAELDARRHPDAAGRIGRSIGPAVVRSDPLEPLCGTALLGIL